MPVDGIDVAGGPSGNNLPSWGDLKAAGIVFIIHKTTEGATIVDPDFAVRWSDTRANGLIRGSFHYYRHSDGTSGEVQANSVLAQLARLLPGDLAPALDFENSALAHNQHEPSVADWRTELGAFLDTLETKLGRTPLIYTSASAWDGHLRQRAGYQPADFAHFGDYPLWVKYYTPRFWPAGTNNIDLDNPPNPWTQAFRQAAASAGDHRYQLRQTTAPPAGILPAPWSTWMIWQYTPYTPGTMVNNHHFDTQTDFDVTNGGIYVLRGVADIGRPGIAFVSGSVSVAHSELDDHLHLLTNAGSTWTDTDLGQGDLPGGGADPVLLESGGALFLYFRSGDAVIEATLSGASSWETKDLTEISSAKPIHDPRAVMDGDKHHVVYWAEDDDWYLLTCDNGWMSVGVLRDAKLGTATGQPVVFVQGGLPHVAGRIDGDGHLWEVWPDLAGGWKTDDVTALALANDPATPAATYSPCAYQTSAGVTLVFRAVGGEIWTIDRTTNTPTNVGAAASAARSLGHPTCFVLNDIPHVVYRGIDGIMYDLSTDSGGAWQVQSICDDKMAADPVATTDGTNGAVAVRAADGMIHVALFNGSAWACNPTTMATPPSPGTPAPDNGGNDKSVG